MSHVSNSTVKLKEIYRQLANKDTAAQGFEQYMSLPEAQRATIDSIADRIAREKLNYSPSDPIVYTAKTRASQYQFTAQAIKNYQSLAKQIVGAASPRSPSGVPAMECVLEDDPTLAAATSDDFKGAGQVEFYGWAEVRDDLRSNETDRIKKAIAVYDKGPPLEVSKVQSCLAEILEQNGLSSIFVVTRKENLRYSYMAEAIEMFLKA